MAPPYYVYELPDGRLFRLAADLCHGSSTTTFQLTGGRVVTAMLASDADQSATPLYDEHGVSTGFMARPPSVAPLPRFVVVPHACCDLKTWQVIDRQSASRRLPRVYESYPTEASARSCAAALNSTPDPIAHYAGNTGCGIRATDWISKDIRRVTCQRCVDFIQTHLAEASRAISAIEGAQS